MCVRMDVVCLCACEWGGGEGVAFSLDLFNGGSGLGQEEGGVVWLESSRLH